MGYWQEKEKDGFVGKMVGCGRKCRTVPGNMNGSRWSHPQAARKKRETWEQNSGQRLSFRSCSYGDNGLHRVRKNYMEKDKT
jgi:hypothetical protein